MRRTLNFLSVTLLAVAATASSVVGEDAPSDCAQAKPIETRIRAYNAVIDAKSATHDPRAEAYRIRAAAYSEKANHKQVIAEFTEAINLKGDDAASYFGRG